MTTEARPTAEPDDLTGETGSTTERDDLSGEAGSAAQAAADDPGSQAEVDISNPESLARWSQALGMPAEVLEGTVKAVGTRIDRIKDYQTGGIAGDQEDA
jgi:hypothetical protein